MYRILDAYDVFERGVIAVMAGLALLLACQAILARYLVPGIRLDWTFEVIIFLLIWCVFLSSARLVQQGGHVRIELFLQFLPRRGRNALAVLTGLIALAVAVLLFFSGIRVVEESIRWNEHTTSSLRLPLWIYYLSLPVGMGLLAVRLAARILLLVTGRLDDTSDHEPVRLEADEARQ